MVASGLCKNGHGDFGPTGEGSSLTTPCFNDVVLVPLASFVFIFILLPLAFIFGHTRFSSAPSPASLPFGGLPRWLGVLYFVVVIALCAMSVLEIARLAIADQGIGLLPVLLVGLIMAAVLVGVRHLLRRTSPGFRRALGWALLAYWTMLIPFEAVKLARLCILEDQTPGVSEYPSSDKVSDNAVILALYAVLFVLEAGSLFTEARGRKNVPKEL